MNHLDKFKNFIEDRNENVKVGLVGAGQMGQGIVAQVSKMYGVDLVCIIDRNQKQLDIASDRYKKHKENELLCSDSIAALDNVELDIVIEATGTPAAGALVAKNVLNRGINLILLNVETEATIGLALRKEAEKKLKDKFNIRDFHESILKNGTLTLPLLQDQISEYISSSLSKN